MRFVWWFLPRQTFPNRTDPTFQGYVFFWKPAVGLVVTEALSLPFRGTPIGWLFFVPGISVCGWLVIVGLVDGVRYLKLPKPRRHG